MPLGIVSIATCCTLPIGTGATQAAELNGYIASYYENLEGFTGAIPQVGFFDPMIARLTAFMTPMATPAVPYMMNYGGYNQASLIKGGWLYAIVSCIISVGWIMTAPLIMCLAKPDHI